MVQGVFMTLLVLLLSCLDLWKGIKVIGLWVKGYSDTSKK